MLVLGGQTKEKKRKASDVTTTQTDRQTQTGKILPTDSFGVAAEAVVRPTGLQVDRTGEPPPQLRSAVGEIAKGQRQAVAVVEDGGGEPPAVGGRRRLVRLDAAVAVVAEVMVAKADK